MPIDNLIAQIDAEIARLTLARSLLEGTKQVAESKPKFPHRPGRSKRKLSTEARARIAEAQRKRWAKQKAAKK